MSLVVLSFLKMLARLRRILGFSLVILKKFSVVTLLLNSYGTFMAIIATDAPGLKTSIKTFLMDKKVGHRVQKVLDPATQNCEIFLHESLAAHLLPSYHG